MKTLHTDVAILGAGTAGLNARRAAERGGASALLIDPGPLGTTCARVGCMPSKLLIAAADAAHHARGAGAFGVRVPEVEIDDRAVMARVRSERDRFVGFVLRSTDRLTGDGALIRGRGRVIEPGLLQVDDHTQIHFGSLVVATGSRPFVPPPYRGLGAVLMDNAGVFELEALPESVLVVGLGVIGLELGQALHRLGARVTLLGIGGGIGPLTDPMVAQVARDVLGAELDLHPDHQLHAVERVDGGARVWFTGADGRQRDEVFERVLIAAGRRPGLSGLGLEHYGLELLPRGLPGGFDPETLQLGGAPVFLAGDVTGERALLHEAADEGKIAGRNAARSAAGSALERPARRAPLGVVFSDPQIATVGAGWSALAGRDPAVGEVDYGDQGRARVMNRHRGWVRIYADRETGELLGAEMFGPDVEHTAHLLAWAVQQGLTAARALEMPFYHPVVEEGIRTALQGVEADRRGRAAA